MQLFAQQYAQSSGSGRFARLARSVARGVGAAALGASMLVASQAFASGTEQLKTFVAQVHSARGTFVQLEVRAPGKAQAASSASAGSGVLSTNGGGKNSTSSGTFTFARPGKFIWQYEKPYAQLLQADGDKLYVYDKDLNQVTVRSLGGALGASPAAILFGSNDLDKNFTLHDAGVKAGIDWLELTPKTKDTQFQRVGIGFKDGNLQAMELHDVFGNVTLLTFSNIQKNPPLPADAFKFTVPKGADVING
ncbi:outer membrane lipoprotein chaperone LolA [bacterium M00.F.Ca.ET.228.01.1.1]|uniref:outer membrane lipoprotein chaperone LolA n=1 Tax=Paraburkholderia phenoliruptrix TaxID=252970 RepID=UPI0010932045|nr:outer membrane lipoprotein chaperone LolA [Paraburkholderia phenoliruptrix]TGP43240.1 outer membrane lipoprotein chaperone LolA [bacterium M00.F.Ca.ET.228.01.1.1]TGS00679.1 outer membrane lipoprotein chaperone LolA [bacterium M00.F.Ca.ET.191.01.1.1]TGU05065.1 outer membrane lipoprotein chaperone LolA [bacterium M00.F.Ca.ET.155.01.1.1]MBW0446822.1 outer membrane lipoprotein chaperone LolA [Paraburkholderia phenoliruptrix]MBW9099318.1 outer membrane lipoprotein chaperone LolA [Paraburkholderi